MKKALYLFSIVVLMASYGGGSGQKATSAADSAQVVQTAKDAYTFCLPLVILDITRRQCTNADTAGGVFAPVNTFLHMSNFPDAAFRKVVRPNADTYYSAAILDLVPEPIVLTVPNTHGRYYMMPMLDAYTNVFASPGTRTTGNDAHNFLITGPLWKSTGTMPAGMEQIVAPTNFVWLVGRTQVNSKEDGEKVVIPLQQQYKLTPLSAWGKPYTAPAASYDASVPKGHVNDIVAKMPIEEFFRYANHLLAENPPPAADTPALRRFAAIGVGSDATFKLSSFDEGVQKALTNVPAEMFALYTELDNKPREMENGWQITRTGGGVYGTDYMRRALIACFGLGANQSEDAIYPNCRIDTDGKQLNGANNYVLHFAKGQTPPTHSFWSLTMYSSDGFFVANPLNRYTVGDRSQLKTNADGSTDIYLQHNSPGKAKESNWLPAPEGDFNLLLRVYWPKPAVINGEWKVPGVKKM